MKMIWDARNKMRARCDEKDNAQVVWLRRPFPNETIVHNPQVPNSTHQVVVVVVECRNSKVGQHLPTQDRNGDIRNPKDTDLGNPGLRDDSAVSDRQPFPFVLSKRGQ